MCDQNKFMLKTIYKGGYFGDMEIKLENHKMGYNVKTIKPSII